MGWKSIYSSITISSVGVGHANSGMNERGLAIGHMGLRESIYPSKDERPMILPSQWIQYMLDKCANTNEVIQEAKKIRITNKMGHGEHYYIIDREGYVAIIEFLEGQLVVYTNKDMPYMLLSNEAYEKSMNDIKEYKGLGGNKVVSDKITNINENTVAEAMAIGCSKVNQFYKKENKNIIQDAFDIHEAMRIPAVDTLPKYQNCETQYATVFDITNLKLYFRTKSNPNIREISFNDFENNCSTKAKLLEIQTSAEGIVNNSFIDYSIEENSKCIFKFYENEINKMPKEDMEFMCFYPEIFQCEK